MTGTPGYLLSEQTVRKLAAAVQRLQNEVYQLKQRLAQTVLPEPQPEIRWGKVTRRDDAAYPDNSNKSPDNYNLYWVEWANVAFDLADSPDLQDGLTANTTVTSSAENYVQARSLYGEGVPEDTTHVIERHWSLAGPRYWIRPMGAVWYRGKAAEGIVVGSSGKVNLLDSADATLMQVTAYYDWMTTNADDLVTNQELVIAWFEQDQRWRIFDADCV